MDPLDFLESYELLQFFHCNKTVMSCMENPHTFLSQLRDYNLIPEDRYKVRHWSANITHFFIGLLMHPNLLIQPRLEECPRPRKLYKEGVYGCSDWEGSPENYVKLWNNYLNINY